MTMGVTAPPPAPDDARRMLTAWTWRLPPRIAAIATTRFGDWYVATPDGAIQLLSIWDGTLCQVAPSRDAWTSWLATDAADAANRSALVAELARRGKRLADDQCFAFVPPPLDGVAIDPARIVAIKLAAITSIMGQTHQQRAARSR